VGVTCVGAVAMSWQSGADLRSGRLIVGSIKVEHPWSSIFQTVVIFIRTFVIQLVENEPQNSAHVTSKENKTNCYQLTFANATFRLHTYVIA
jgi:hypothetical protein